MRWHEAVEAYSGVSSDSEDVVESRGQRDKMPLAAVHLHVIIFRALHVHIRHTGRSPSVPRFAVVDARLGGLGDELGVSQFTSFLAGTCWRNRVKSQKGVLAQLVERLNGIEAFLSRKLLITNVPYLLCHTFVSQHATGSWYGRA